MSKFLEYWNNRFYKEEKKFKLIKSQLELLKMLAAGLTIKEIALRTNKKYETVKNRGCRKTQKLTNF